MTEVIIVREETTSVTVVPAPGIAVIEVDGGAGVSPEYVADAIQEHVDAPDPHPVYDDLASFTLLFENGLV